VTPPKAEPHKEHELNAAPEDQLRLLDLQDLDSRLDRLAHRRRTLPELAEVERLSTRQGQLRDLVVEAETLAGDLTRAQTKAEADVEQVRARSARDQERLDSGRVGSAKELGSLQHEIGSLARRQADLEEIVLDVMERLEEAAARAAALRAEQNGIEGELATAEQHREAAFGEIDTETEALRQQREALAQQLPSDLATLYEKLRAQHGGVGAAALRQRRCEGCRLELNTVDIGRIRTARPDEVLRCEECRRILVRTAESGL
jgi:uncharacterized protein